MHLRGPVNVSQLAVYQVPSEAFKMQKRATVPFYNRRRALNRRATSDNSTDAFSHNSHNVPALEKQVYDTSVACSHAATTTSTVFVTDCTATPTSAVYNLQSESTDPRSPLPPPNISTVARSTSNHMFNTTAWPFQNTTKQAVPLVAPNSRKTTNDSSTNRIHPRAAGWTRVGYYTSSSPAQATGLSFLANLGDPRESGTFD